MANSFTRARWALAVVMAFVGGLMIASGMDLTRPTFAQNRPSAMDVQTVAEASNAFVSISESVTPAVVSITVDIRPDTTRGRNRAHPQIPPGLVPEGMEELFEQLQQGQGAPRVQTGMGSGVIVSKDGYILTNNHVVTRNDMRTIADRVTVRLLNGRQYVAKVVGTDPTTDVAVLKIQGDNFPFAVLGDDNRSRVGEWVLAIGNPLGFDHTVTAGIISAKGRGGQFLAGLTQGNQYGIFDFIQTDAAINRGNSGGPLINSRGEVLGINTAIASENGLNAGYGFAIPISLARKVMTDIIEHGRVRIAVLGIQIGEIDADDAAAARLPDVRGVKVGGFASDNSPARAAGVREGDVIVAADGQPVDRVAGLQRIVRSHQPGETVELQVVRFGTRHTFRVRLTEAPTEEIAAAPNRARPRVEPANVTSNNRLGISVSPVSGQLAETLRLGDQRGVIVTEVVGLGPAWQRLGERDIIVGVLSPVERKIENVTDLQQVLSTMKAGDYISLRVLSARPNGAPQSRVVNIRVD